MTRTASRVNRVPLFRNISPFFKWYYVAVIIAGVWLIRDYIRKR